ncbi:MAG: patatin-like phospholipase family protein [Bacteriovoracaceae bacterium]|nr:patatin-like phospholipase family protein [Bacteriovoracaceae bacterium]
MNKIKVETLKGKKIGLVLSGGVVRAAAWHLGVALALEDLGFRLGDQENMTTKYDSDLWINTFVGSSAGSLISTYLANGYSPHDIIASIMGHNNKIKKLSYSDMLSLKKFHLKTSPQYKLHPEAGLPTILKSLIAPLYKVSGFFTTEGLKAYLLDYVIKSDDFASLKSDLFIVATQLDHSRKVIFSRYNYPNTRHDSTAQYYTGARISDAAAASMTVPPFYRPYPIYNNHTHQVDYYIDGEIRETLSTHAAIDNGCDVVINSWTHTPYHYHDEIGSLVHQGIPAILVQSIFLMIQKKIINERSQRSTAKDLVETLHEYLTREKFSAHHRNEILSIVERKLDYRPELQIIDIYPDHDDHEMFFTGMFSLNQKELSNVVRKGYKKTMQTFDGISGL